MSWVRVDDEFMDHAKVAPLSDAAVRLWMEASCWSRKPHNLKHEGRIPEALLVTIAKNRYPRAKALKLAAELVAANGGGLYGQGLWVVVDGGWQIHDWLHWGPLRPSWSDSNYPFVFERDGEVCRYCGRTENLSVDHVVPRCQGGGDQLENLVVACRSCNSRKGGRTPEQAGMVLQ
jgi:hypothetical protein